MSETHTEIPDNQPLQPLPEPVPITAGMEDTPAEAQAPLEPPEAEPLKPLPDPEDADEAKEKPQTEDAETEAPEPPAAA